jgi:hypothetical protein
MAEQSNKMAINKKKKMTQLKHTKAKAQRQKLRGKHAKAKAQRQKHRGESYRGETSLFT